ncbi:hypothetical protein M8494_00355 [Serratia ureilytica]
MALHLCALNRLDAAPLQLGDLPQAHSAGTKRPRRRSQRVNFRVAASSPLTEGARKAPICGLNTRSLQHARLKLRTSVQSASSLGCDADIGLVQQTLHLFCILAAGMTITRNSGNCVHKASNVSHAPERPFHLHHPSR